MIIGGITPGQTIAGYRLLRLLGRGHDSEVYLCKHPKIPQLVAVKLLYARTSGREVQHFLTQSAMLNTLDHPHIIRIYDFGLIDNNIPYLAMNYASHGTLRQNYPRGTRLPLATVVGYIKQAADALQYVHEHQLVHRDVKPQNMLLGTNNEVILNDFGTATVSYSLIPNMVDFEGTVLYAAPEQLEGRPRRSSDQYALAVVTYELLSGAWPFIGTFEEVAQKHLYEQPPTLRSKGIKVHRAVEGVLQRALSKEVASRFPCIQDFAVALENAWMLDRVSEKFRVQQLPVRRQFRSPLPFLP